MADTPAEQPSSIKAKTETVKVPEKKKSNKTLFIILGLVLFFFVIVPGLLFAAGGAFIKSKFGSDKATEKTLQGLVSTATNGAVNVDSANGSVSVKSNDGSSISSGANQKLPSDFPKNEIPYLSEKAVTFVITSNSDGKKNWSVTTTVDESFDKAKTYFEGKIKEPDFTDVASYGSGDSQTYTGKGTKYSVYVSVIKVSESEPTNVTYIVTEE